MSTLRNTTSSSDLAEQRALLASLQARVEREKVEFGRVLHDELGGLLVAALMDTTWVEQRLAGVVSDDTLERLQRARATLATAIDRKRKLIEELYPTLLANVGLFAALSWHFKHGCDHAHLRCSANFPAQELALTAEGAISVFRVVQEALQSIIDQRESTSVDLDVKADLRHLVIRLTYDGRALCERDPAEFPEFAFMRNRVWQMHGTVDARRKELGAVITLTIPLSAITPPRSDRGLETPAARPRLAKAVF